MDVEPDAVPAEKMSGPPVVPAPVEELATKLLVREEPPAEVPPRREIAPPRPGPTPPRIRTWPPVNAEFPADRTIDPPKPELEEPMSTETEPERPDVA